jgi:hypothetical protein
MDFDLHMIDTGAARLRVAVDGNGPLIVRRSSLRQTDQGRGPSGAAGAACRGQRRLA